MDLNVLGISFLGLVVAYLGYQSYIAPSIPTNKHLQLPVPIENGKTHAIQSKTGDASMRTELLRRRAIRTIGIDKLCKIKETRTLLGSHTGAIETYFLSSICPPKQSSDNWFDGGNEFSEFCGPSQNSLDAGTIIRQ